MRLGRGTLAPGAAGDVTVFSTGVEWTYDVNQSASRSRNSPFHGSTFHGGALAPAGVATQRAGGAGSMLRMAAMRQPSGVRVIRKVLHRSEEHTSELQSRQYL